MECYCYSIVNSMTIFQTSTIFCAFSSDLSTNTHPVTLTNLDRTLTLHIPAIRSYFPTTVLRGMIPCIDAFPGHNILTSPCPIVIYLPYPQKLHFLNLPVTFISHNSLNKTLDWVALGPVLCKQKKYRTDSYD